MCIPCQCVRYHTYKEQWDARTQDGFNITELYNLTSTETLYKFQTAWPAFQPLPPIFPNEKKAEGFILLLFFAFFIDSLSGQLIIQMVPFSETGITYQGFFLKYFANDMELSQIILKTAGKISW